MQCAFSGQRTRNESDESKSYCLALHTAKFLSRLDTWMTHELDRSQDGLRKRAIIMISDMTRPTTRDHASPGSQVVTREMFALLADATH